jgi:peptidoglycan hydrolase-like protein with peptidoglycan-binding domain
MDFKGSSIRLVPSDIETTAHELGCDVAAVKAIIHVEAAGEGFDAQGRPKALFEPHKFYSHLGSGVKRDRAVVQGLAYEHWRPGNYPKTSEGVYAQIAKACAIDEDAALLSCSWGLGQVMGENHPEAGFSTVQAFVEKMKRSEANQLGIVAALIEHWKLADELGRHDWDGFARGWNGPGYKKNDYAGKLQRAFYAAGGSANAGQTQALNASYVAKLGDRGDVVTGVQKLLVSAGFRVSVDGDYGNTTKQAVRLFQLDVMGLGSNGTAFGLVDEATFVALKNAPPVLPEPERADATPADLRVQGSKIVTGATGIRNATALGGMTTFLTGLAHGDLGSAATAAKDTADHVQTISDAASSVSGVAGQVTDAYAKVRPVLALVEHYWWLVLVVGLIYVAFMAHDVVKARVADHNSGKTL